MQITNIRMFRRYRHKSSGKHPFTLLRFKMKVGENWTPSVLYYCSGGIYARTLENFAEKCEEKDYV